MNYARDVVEAAPPAHLAMVDLYPRVIDFAEELPRTTSGKLRRSALRGEN